MPRVRRLQAIGSEVQSNEIRLLVLMPRLEVKAGTAGGGHRGMDAAPVHGMSAPTYPPPGWRRCLRTIPKASPSSSRPVDETVFRSRRNHPETKGWVSSSPSSRGWPKCSFCSNWFGTSHAAITSPQWVSGRSSNDGGNSRYSHAH